MSAEDHDEPGAARRRFSVDDARARATRALRKSEFILSRAYGLFREPKQEWAQIRAEVTTVPNILLGYVAPLAAIPPVCDLIGSYAFNRVLTGDVGPALIRAAVTWLVSVALVFFLGVLINTLAQNFSADKDDLAAQKVAAYSLTPAFLSGVFSLWPPLWWLSLFALAAMVFLMYRGLPILMKAPEESALGYAATVTIAAMVGGIVLFSLASCVTTG
jgi:hypothetical protein